MQPPRWQDNALPSMKDFRLRTGVWFCGKGACKRKWFCHSPVAVKCGLAIGERLAEILLDERIAKYVLTFVWLASVDRNISVTIIFTLPTPVSEHIVTKLLFDYLWRDNEFDQPREDEEGICWTFSRLYYLLSDWQNIIGEVLARLDEAEINSHGRHLPVKARTRRMHREVDRIYEMKEYLHFHTRSFKKLQKLQNDVPAEERKDPLWYVQDVQ